MLSKRNLTILLAAIIATGSIPLLGEDSAHGGHGAPAKPAAPAAGHDPHADPHAAAPHVASKAPAGGHDEGVPPDEALKRLIDGNERFVAKALKRPNQDQARLCDTFANGQHPFAAILSCADSRVPPEFVFDAGIGDLFVVRVAGNVAATDEIGTLEYGIEHLGINAVLVMGHLKCGAVTAVVDKAAVTPNIAKLVEPIGPAADKARQTFPQLSGPRLVDKAIRQNVYQSIADLQGKSELIRERVKSGKLKIVGGVYNLHTGEVDWLEGNPGAGNINGDPKKPGTEMLHEKSADPHGKPSAEHGKETGPHAAGTPVTPATPAKKDNYLVLGGLVGGGAAVSFGIMHFIRRK